MSIPRQDLTRDAFLGGALALWQPRLGYRAATDPVFLAAAVPARAGQSVLELGCGVGVASLCLGHRVSGACLTGAELQADYADLARRNGIENGVEFAVHSCDIRHLPEAVKAQSFDHVLSNPPYFARDAISRPQDQGKDIAHREHLSLADWIDIGFKRLRPGGYFTIIHLAERLPDIVTRFAKRGGDIRIKPIAPRTGRDANRVIVRARKGAKGAAGLAAPLVVHEGDQHQVDGASFTRDAEAILRHGAALEFGAG